LARTRKFLARIIKRGRAAEPHFRRHEPENCKCRQQGFLAIRRADHRRPVTGRVGGALPIVPQPVTDIADRQPEPPSPPGRAVSDWPRLSSFWPGLSSGAARQRPPRRYGNRSTFLRIKCEALQHPCRSDPRNQRAERPVAAPHARLLGRRHRRRRRLHRAVGGQAPTPAPEGRRCCARPGDVLSRAVLRHSPRARVSPGSRRACRAATGGFPPAAGPVEAGSSVRAGRPGGGYGSIGHHACGGRRGAPHDLCRAGRGPGDITGVSQAARPAASLGATDRQRRCHPGDSAALGPRHVRETRTNQGKECRPRQRSDVTGDRGASPGDTRCCHR